MNDETKATGELPSNFIFDIIDQDLARGEVEKIHTRFPPEPNGYLHIGSTQLT